MGERLMPLSCDCGDFDPSDLDRWWYGPNDYTEMPKRKRRARCVSCKDLIENSAVVTRFDWYRHPNQFEDEKLGWSEVGFSTDWMCETCSDIFFSLTELGFCMNLDTPMREHLADYHSLYGSTKVASD